MKSSIFGKTGFWSGLVTFKALALAIADIPLPSTPDILTPEKDSSLNPAPRIANLKFSSICWASESIAGLPISPKVPALFVICKSLNDLNILSWP